MNAKFQIDDDDFILQPLYRHLSYLAYIKSEDELVKEYNKCTVHTPKS